MALSSARKAPYPTRRASFSRPSYPVGKLSRTPGLTARLDCAAVPAFWCAEAEPLQMGHITVMRRCIYSELWSVEHVEEL